MNKTLGSVFSSAWKTATRNFLPLLLIQLIFMGILYGVIYVCMLPFILNPYSSETTGALALLPVLVVVIAIFLMPLYAGAMAAIINRFDAEGRNIGIRDAFGYARKNYVKYLTTSLVTILFSVAFAFVAVLICLLVMIPSIVSTAISSSYSYYDSTATAFMMVVPAVIVVSVLALLFGLGVISTNYIPQVEGKSGFNAFFTSFKYAFKGKFWRNLGHFLLISIMIGTISGIVSGVINQASGMSAVLTMLGGYTDMAGTSAAVLSGYISAAMGVGVISLIVSCVLGTFQQSFLYEIYKNARFSSDVKDAVKRLQAPQAGRGSGYH
jgi:MFS family permease